MPAAIDRSQEANVEIGIIPLSRIRIYILKLNHSLILRR